MVYLDYRATVFLKITHRCVANPIIKTKHTPALDKIIPG